MLTSFFLGIALFFLHALVLKVAVGTMGAPSIKNSYSKALSIAFGLNVAGLVIGFITGFVPIVGLVLGAIIYGAVWVGVIMSAYDLGFMRSLGVAILQVVLKFALTLLLSLFGISVAFSETMTMGF